MPRVVGLDDRSNAYVGSFYAALEACGVSVIDGWLSGGWIVSTLRRGDVVHLNWPSFFYPARGGYLALVWGLLRFAALLLLLRLRGARLVWTAHNLLPHERCRIGWIDVAARRLVITLSDRIFVHGEEAARLLVARFPVARRKLTIIPHGNWMGQYPDATGRTEARRRLELPESAFVFLCIGLVRPYKNVDGLIEAFAGLTGDDVLVIAGRIPEAWYEQRVRALAAPDRRVRFHAGYIPDEELQLFLNACNAVVAPYRDILTSGTAVLAAGFGRPIVSPDRGFLRDVVTPETGILYDPDREAALRDALEDARLRPFDPARIRAHAARFRFEDAARIFAQTIGL